MVSSRCLLSMLVGFPFLAFRTFHNKLVLMKNLDASILYVLQHSVFFALHYLFLSLLWEVHLSKICSKSALVIPFTTPRCNIRSTQKFVTFTLYLWITLTKNFMKKKKTIRKACEKKFVWWGRQFSSSSETDKSAKAYL